MRYLEIDLISKLNQIFHENELKMRIETHSIKETKHEKMIIFKKINCRKIKNKNGLSKLLYNFNNESNHVGHISRDLINRQNSANNKIVNNKNANDKNVNNKIVNDKNLNNKNVNDKIVNEKINDDSSILYYLKTAFENFYPDGVCKLSFSDFEEKSLEDFKSEIQISLLKIQNAPEFLYNILYVIDSVNNFKDSTIFSLNSRVGPYKNVFSFNCFFFFNKKMKRVTVIDIIFDK
ncbi:hypothetical protein DMUE_5584 [Dictyocoela muelleri]|nr:hypothetical protein DMUE_5584 [Dictyocoela muelleri]